jgi:hypothetical protein
MGLNEHEAVLGLRIRLCLGAVQEVGRDLLHEEEAEQGYDQRRYDERRRHHPQLQRAAPPGLKLPAQSHQANASGSEWMISRTPANQTGDIPQPDLAPGRRKAGC